MKTVLKIDGMMCSMCESHINDVIRQNFDVKKVSSSHKTGCTVIVSEQALNREQLEQALSRIGYRLVELTEENEQTNSDRHRFKLFNRR